MFTKRYLGPAVFVILLLIVNIVALRGWISHFGHDHKASDLPGSLRPKTILRYGSTIPQISGQSLHGDKTINVRPDAVNLLLCFTPHQQRGQTIGIARAAELFCRTYGRDKVNVTALVRGDIPEIRDLVEHALIKYDVIADEDGALSKKLGVGEYDNGFFLFDEKGTCRVSTSYAITPEYLHQILSVEALRSDPGAGLKQGPSLFQTGRRLPPLPVNEVNSFSPTSLDRLNSGGSDLFVFFTADCSVCSLPKYLALFSEFEQRQSSAQKPKNAVLVFDYNFSRNDVLDNLKKAGINKPAFIAAQGLKPASEAAPGDDVAHEQVFVAETGRNGVATSLYGLSGKVAEKKSPSTTATAAPLEGKDNPAAYEEVFSNASFTPFQAAPHGDRLFASDIKRNRIVVLNRRGEIEREMGRVGSGPGQLIRPESIGVSGDGTVYVYDAYNDRIQSLGADGAYKGEFSTTPFIGFAVSSGGEVYLGQPEKGSLVTVYSGEGKKLRSIGKLKTFSEIYGDKFTYKDELYRLGINRVNLFIDAQDNLYVSFMLAPIVQKYSPDGKLLFERRLEGERIEKLTEILLKDTDKIYVTTSIDGFQEKIITINPVVDPRTGHIYTIFIDGSIYLLDEGGNPLNWLEPRTTRRFFPDTAGLGVEGELLLIAFKPRTWYRLTMKPVEGGL